jgi:hypothetical protein
MGALLRRLEMEDLLKGKEVTGVVNRRPLRLEFTRGVTGIRRIFEESGACVRSNKCADRQGEDRSGRVREFGLAARLAEARNGFEF